MTHDMNEVTVTQSVSDCVYVSFIMIYQSVLLQTYFNFLAIYSIWQISAVSLWLHTFFAGYFLLKVIYYGHCQLRQIWEMLDLLL